MFNVESVSSFAINDTLSICVPSTEALCESDTQPVASFYGQNHWTYCVGNPNWADGAKNL